MSTVLSSNIAELIVAGEILRFEEALKTFGDDEETKTNIIETVLSHDHIDAFKALIHSNYLDLEKYRSKKGQTVLHIAVLQGCLRVIDYVAFSDPSSEFVNAQTQFGETIIHLIASLGDVELLRRILALFSTINLSLLDKYDRSGSQIAIDTGNFHLIGDGLLPNASSKSESVCVSPPLHSLKAQLNTDFMDELSRRTADRASKTSVKVTVKNTFSVVVENLAAPTSVDSNSILTAPSIGKAANTGIPLSKMMEYPGDIALLRNLPLLPSGNGTVYYDANGKDSFGLAAIHKACAWHQLDVLTYLLCAEGVDVNISAAANVSMAFTPLHMAVDSSCLPAAQLLLSDPRIEKNKEDNLHRTALQYAQEKCLQPFIDLLS